MSTNLKKVQEKAIELKNDLDVVALEMRRIQSLKCRLKKQKFKKSYDADMRELLAQEQLVKEVRELIAPKSATVTTITQDQIDVLTYDETIKAIKSIQSKKCNTQFLTEDKATNAAYQDACRIEQLLLAHKSTVKPLAETVVSKLDVKDIITQLENSQDDLDKTEILRLLSMLVK